MSASHAVMCYAPVCVLHLDLLLLLLLMCFDPTVCIAGYGQQGVSTDCTPCDYGSYHPGGGIKCSQCPTAKFYAPVDGTGDIWESQGG